jgi:periplasmic mercuric ion binding protein
MKTIKWITVVLAFVLPFATMAQKTKLKEVKITTSAVCSMCKETIENALAFEGGVKKATLDVDTKIVTVIYNIDKTNIDKIKLAIANAGYDADDIKANAKAYEKLEDCCKKGKICNEKK